MFVASSSFSTVSENDEIANSQLLGLLCALLEFNAWEDAQQLMSLLANHGASSESLLLSSPPLRTALLDMLSRSLDGVCGSLFAADLHDPQTVAVTNQSNGSDSDNNSQFAAVVHFADEFFDRLWAPLQLLGLHLAEHSRLCARLCALLRQWLQRRTLSSSVSSAAVPVEEVVQSLTPVLLLLLRALSLSGADATVFSSQLWSVLALLQWDQRAALYELWQQNNTDSSSKTDNDYNRPWGCAVAERESLQATRRELKRLTRETAKAIGCRLAKHTHANPLVCAQHLLAQVESFDNLLPFILEALRFSSELTRDVIAACLLMRLEQSQQRGLRRIKEADTHYEAWFLALARFAGGLHCRFPQTELRPLLHYLLRAASAGRAADLLLLQELLASAHSLATRDLSAAQLEGLAGGRVLRSELLGLLRQSTTAGSSGTNGANLRAAKAVREAMVSSQTALPLLLFTAQLRNTLLFDSSSPHLKLVSFLCDSSQHLLMQFADFLLGDAKTGDDIEREMPSLNAMLDEIGLSLPMAFQLVRPLLRSTLMTQLHSPSQVQPLLASVPAVQSRWWLFGENVQRALQSHASLQQSPSSVLSLRLQTLFWSLSLHDISVPVDRYQLQIKLLKDKYADLDKRKASTTALSLKMSQSEFSKWSRQRDADMKQMMICIAALAEELAVQKKHTEAVKALLLSEKDALFVVSDQQTERADSESEGEGEGERGVLVKEREKRGAELCDALLQQFVLPRMRLGPAEALYCVRFFKLLHELETPGFCLLQFYDRLLDSCLPLLFASTEAEARLFGHALFDALSGLNRWRAKASIFQAETAGKVFCLAAVLQSSDGTVSHKKFLDLMKVRSHRIRLPHTQHAVVLHTNHSHSLILHC
jgi:THO complex subunit 2